MTRFYRPAVRPTIYFIGVTTSKSSIMKIFPRWAEYLGLSDTEIKGIDFPPHAEPGAYREVVEFIKKDPLSAGALVTTHKIDLFNSCRDIFDEIDPFAQLMSETSCLSKANGKLVCHAKDPISSGLALEGFLPPNHWGTTGAEVFIMGAGGSAIAMTWYLTLSDSVRETPNRPSRIMVSNRSQARLSEIRRIHEKSGVDVPVEYVLAPRQIENDAMLSHLKPCSLVVNATGLGKDAPGSPISHDGQFPEQGIVWELNYRGELVFLDQARDQQAKRRLQIEDGWTYFIHGWTRVIAEVFHIHIPVSGTIFDQLSDLALRYGRPSSAGTAS
jgi:shikimate 5-dehydrogenase